MTTISPAQQSKRVQGTASLSETQTMVLHSVREQAQQLNAAIEVAVQAGMTIEIARTHRCYAGQSGWGDQVAAVIETVDAGASQ